MPVHLKQLCREAYCSAPPIPTSSLHPPRLTRETELCRSRAPLQTELFVKREVSSIESVKFEAEEFKPDVKPFSIPFDPRQRDDLLQVGIAALTILTSSSSSYVDEGPSTSPGPSCFAEPWGLRGQRLSHVPEGDLGPADPARRRGRPKGSKYRPRVAFKIVTLPERQKLKAEERLAKMASK